MVPSLQLIIGSYSHSVYLANESEIIDGNFPASQQRAVIEQRIPNPWTSCHTKAVKRRGRNKKTE